MTPSEAAFVLAHAAIADKRTIGELEAKLWARMIHPDITVDDAVEAVARHYADTTDWLMPAHINDLARRIAGTRIAETRRLEVEAQIARDNPPAELHPHPVQALTVGQNIPPPTDTERAESRALQLRQAVAAGRKPAAALDTAAAAAEQARRAQAHAELEAARAAHATSNGQATPDEATETAR